MEEKLSKVFRSDSIKKYLLIPFPQLLIRNLQDYKNYL